MNTNIVILRTFAAFCGVLTASAQTPTAILPLFPPVISTSPSNGDLNPYGLAVVPRTLLGTTVLQTGDILVSNFNNSDNLQGTGTTIVRFNHQGQQSLFYQGKGLGFSGALGILSDGIVVAGSTPTTDGTPATLQPGSLLFIDPRGNLLATLNQSGLIDGPWGLAIHDFGGGAAQIFVSNVLSGQIVRFDVTYDGGGQTIAVQRAVTVASGYPHRTDPGAIALGPSGLAYDVQHDILYAANSADNAIFAINGAAGATSSQGIGSMIFNDATKLHGPVNLVLAPNGHLIVANSDGSNPDPQQPSELVEFTTSGQFIGQYSLDQGNGAAFGISFISVAPGIVRVAAVDDSNNTLKTFIAQIQ